MVEFPDELSESEIKDALDRHFSEAQAPAGEAPQEPIGTRLAESAGRVALGIGGLPFLGVAAPIAAFPSPWKRLSRGFMEAAGRASQALGTVAEFAPMAPPGVITPEIAQAEVARAQRPTAERIEGIRHSPFYQAGTVARQGPEELLPLTEQQKADKIGNVIEAAGGMAGYVASGPLAPGLIGTEAFTEHAVNDYDAGLKAGLSEEQAAARAMEKGIASGGIQAAIFAALPGPLRKLGDKYLIARFGAGKIAPFIARRVSHISEVGTLMGTAAAGENIVSGRPVLEGVPGAFGAGALLGGLTPRAPSPSTLAAIARAKRSGLTRAAIEAEKGAVEDAQRIREDAEQVPSRRAVAEGGKGEGGKDLEQPAPGEPGRAAPGGEPGAPQEGQAGLLLDNRPAVKLMPEEGQEPQFLEAQQKPDGTWETHDEIIQRNKLSPDMIDRRVFLDREGNEKSREQTATELQQQGIPTKVEGEAHSTDVNKAAETKPSIVTPEVQALVDEHAQSTEAKLEYAADPTEVESAVMDTMAEDNVRDVLSKELGRKPHYKEIAERRDEIAKSFGYEGAEQFDAEIGEKFPFADRRAKPIAHPDFKKGTIRIYPKQLMEWLQREVPYKQWNAAVRALISEESIHLKTAAEDAVAYWDALSGLEKYAEQRVYLGRNWRKRMARGDFSTTELGYEAIRRRMQRLARMETREAASTAGRERWTIKSLELMGDVLRSTREKLGTTAATEQRAIIDKMLGNIDAAKSAMIAGAAKAPAAVTREEAERQAKDIGFTLSPVTQYGSVDARGLKPAEIQELKDAGFPATWEFTDRRPGSETEGFSFYVPEGASRQEIVTALNQGRQARGLAPVPVPKGEAVPLPAAIEREPWKRTLYYGDFYGKQSGRLTGSKFGDYGKGIYITPNRTFAEDFAKGTAFGISGEARKAASGVIHEVEIDPPAKTFYADKTALSPKEIKWWADNGFETQWLKTRADLIEQEGGRAVGPFDLRSQSEAWDEFLDHMGYDAVFDGQQLVIRKGDARLKRSSVPAAAMPEPPEGDRLVTVEEASGKRYLAAFGDKYYDPDTKKFASLARYVPGNKLQWSHGILPKGAKIIEDGGASAPEAQAAALPMATRREEGKKTPEFYLPPVPRGTEVERGGFQQPTPDLVRDIADAHFSDLTKAPSFDAFKGELEGQFGAMKPEAAYYAWQDAMFKRLMTAKGAEVERIMDQLGLRGKVAVALKPGEAEPKLGRGKIPDPVELQTQPMSLFEFERRRREASKRFTPEQRIRYAALSEIADKLMKEAGPKPKKPWSRTQIGPEDVSHVMQVVKGAERVVDPQTGIETLTQPDVESLPAWYTFKPEDIKDAATLGEFVTRGARVGDTTKYTVSNNVIAVRGKDGKIHVVSVFNDPRTGPKATNPAGADKTARRIDDAFLADYQPTSMMRLREPVERFNQTFDTQEAFDNHFGDLAIEGTAGVGASSFVGPQAGTIRSQAGLRGAARAPTAEAPLPKPFVTEPAPLESSFQAISGARELTVPRFARTRVPTGAIPPGLPRPEPERMLPPGSIPEVAPETTPMQERLPYETLPRPTVSRPITEYGKPLPRQPGTEIRAGLEPALARRAPYAFFRDAADEYSAVKSDMKKLMQTFPVADRPARMADAASNTAHIRAQQQENSVRFASVQRRPGLRGKLAGTWTKGDPQMLAAANALIEAKAVRLNGTIDNGRRGQLNIFRQLTLQGLARARQMEGSTSWHLRRIGRAWARNQRNLLKELDFAEAHWNDPVLRETAARASRAFREQIDFERGKGFDITQKPGYDPHRYDAALWNGESFLFQLTSYERKILGKKFRESQLFPSYYHAGAAGPYLAVTRDVASLVNHRIRQGQNLVLQDAWKESLRNVRLPDGRPLAIDPVAGAHRKWLSPKADYQVVPGANHLAIQDEYVPLIRQLTDPSHIELFGPSRALLHASQVLKHSILVGDFFHLGRMIYYAMATMGTKAGYKSGWTVLDIAPRDVPEAIAKGIIRQKDADWANTPVPFGRGTITRRQLATKFYEQMGANLGRVQDALYKDLLTETSPTAGALRRGVTRAIDPSIGRYNRFLFDQLTRGFMAEANVREFERQMRANPNASPHRLMLDIARDVNNFFGNIGRQGWFKSKTMQDINRMLFLAPQWVEGLLKKELVAYGRLSGVTQAAGLRRGPTALGMTGTAIGRGMLFMVAITQLLNLISRRQPTWQNPEKEHRFDAWIPGWGADSEGFWLSPLAIYNEVSHDVYRLANTKRNFAEALSQIAANKEQPVTRALLVGATGFTPMGQKITTTAGRAREMGKAVVPVPISFGKIGQFAGSKLAPGLVPPPPPQAVPRQLAATLGVKIEPAETAIQRVAKIAKDFMDREGLTKETGWQQIQTDEPGYSKLRAAIRSGDWKGARRNLDALRKTRSDTDIMRAMKLWAKRGFTGSLKNEGQFRNQLSTAEEDLYDKAIEQKQLQFEAFLDWFYNQD